MQTTPSTRSILQVLSKPRLVDLVEPVDGLVVSVPVLADAQSMHRHGPELSALLVAPSDEGDPALTDPALFDRGAALPDDLSLYPSWSVMF
jgi:hypothetical protein